MNQPNGDMGQTYAMPQRDMSDEALASYFQGWIGESNRYRRSAIDKLPMQYDAYHCINTGEVAPQANNLGLPMVYAMVQTAVAREANALFGQDPIIGFHGYAPGEEAIANKNEVLVTAQLREDNIYTKGIDFLTQSYLTGTGICRMGWRREVRKRSFRVPDGMGGIHKVSKDITEFDGPSLSVVDLLDFYPEANKKFIRDMARCGHRYYDDYDSMVERDSAYRNAFGENYYLPGALNKLMGRTMPSITDIRIRRLGLHPSQFGDPQSGVNFGKPVELMDIIGLFPPEMAIDGDRNCIYTVANGTIVVARRPLPYYNGKKPFVSLTPSPDPYGFYGVGIADLVEPVQAAAARLMNTRLDVGDRVLQPMFIGDARKLGAIKRVNSKPGGITLVQGDINGALAPIAVNLQGFSSSFQEMAELRQMGEMATGLSEDGVQGLQGSDRQTAREFLGRQEASNTRLGLAAGLASVWLEEVGEWCRDLDQQYLELPNELNIIGNLAQTDPETGLPVPPEKITIEAQDLVHNWKAKAMGPLMLTSKASQRQDAMQLIQTFGSVPPLAQQLQWGYVAKKIATLFDGWDPIKLLVQTGQIPSINQAGQDPEQQAAASSTEPGMPVNQQQGSIVGPMGPQSMTQGAPGNGPDNLLGGA